MSKKVAFAEQSFSRQIQLARPTARSVVERGIEALLITPGSQSADDGDIIVAVSDMLGKDLCELVNGENYELLDEGLRAALALGIALGQLVRPDAFSGGGR